MVGSLIQFISLAGFFLDAQNPAFWRIFSQNDPPKISQCAPNDAIPKNSEISRNFPQQ